MQNQDLLDRCNVEFLEMRRQLSAHDAELIDQLVSLLVASQPQVRAAAFTMLREIKTTRSNSRSLRSRRVQQVFSYLSQQSNLYACAQGSR